MPAAKYWRAIVACFKWKSLQMYVFVLNWQKKKRKLFGSFRWKLKLK